MIRLLNFTVLMALADCKKMKIFILLLFLMPTDAFIDDYISGIRNYLGISKQSVEDTGTEIFERKVPYEVSAIDEKFISEAAKLTGVVLSELDSCQHRVRYI